MTMRNVSLTAVAALTVALAGGALAQDSSTASGVTAPAGSSYQGGAAPAAAAPAAEAPAAEAPAAEAPAPALDAGWDDAEPTATAQNLPGLASAAGIADGEMATLLGMSKGYYSQVRNGKRPWPGLKPDQVQRLRAELAGRREAIDAVEAALSTADVLKPEGA